MRRWRWPAAESGGGGMLCGVTTAAWACSVRLLPRVRILQRALPPLSGLGLVRPTIVQLLTSCHQCTSTAADPARARRGAAPHTATRGPRPPQTRGGGPCDWCYHPPVGQVAADSCTECMRRQSGAHMWQHASGHWEQGGEEAPGKYACRLMLHQETIFAFCSSTGIAQNTCMVPALPHVWPCFVRRITSEEDTC